MKAKVFVDALFYKTLMGLKAEISRLYLQSLWWIISPLLTMAVLYVVFGVFLSQRTENFPLFLLCGIVHWEWFAKSVGGSTKSIIGARHLTTQLKIPKLFFPLEVVVREAYKYVFALILLFIFLFFNGAYPTTTWLFFPVILLIQLTLNAGIAVFCALLIPFMEDLDYIIQTGLRLAFFATGIFWDLESILSDKYLQIVYFNPMAGIINSYRQVLIYNQWPDLSQLLYGLAFGLFFLLIGICMSHLLHERYMEKWYQ